MGWLEDTQNHRRLQTEQMQKAFGNDGSEDLREAINDTDFSESEAKIDKKKTLNGKSNMYKMRLLGLRKFNEQDQKIYLGVEDIDNSYIANLDDGDIVVSKTADGYLVSKFPIDMENKDGEEKETDDLSSAIDIALKYKEDLEVEEEPEQIMYKENAEKASGDDDEEDETDKSFEDEINPFDVAAWEAEHNDVAKAYAILGLDYDIEKAKHQDGDMHPNGKWVWRQSANGGKGDWRVAKTGGSKATTGGGAAATDEKIATKQTSSTLNDKIINSQSASAAKAYVKFLDGKNESMSFNDHFAEAIERANGDTNKVLKVFKEHLKKHLASAGVAPESVDSYYKQFQGDLDKTAIKNYLKKKGIEWNWTKEGDAKKVPSSIKWDDITVTKLDDGGLYTMLDKKKKIVTIGSKQYRVDLQNESLLHMNSGVKVKNNSPEMARFKKLLDANRKGDGKSEKSSYESEKSSNTVTHDINGTKVTVTKNSDGSYTLEANGKKVKSGDPSFFVFGTAIKPRVKNALAKIVGLETKK